MTVVQRSAEHSMREMHLVPFPPAGAVLPADAPDILPESAPPTPGQITDAIATLDAFQLVSQATDERCADAQLQSNEMRKHEQLEKQKQSLDRQSHDTGGRGFFSCIGDFLKDTTVDLVELRFGKLASDVRVDGSACDNPQFWSDLEVGAKIVAAVAAAVATVMSAGTLGPVVVGVALALSAAGFAIQETHCLGSASDGVGVGCEVAAAVVTFGASAGTAGAAASSALAQTSSGVAQATGAGATAVAGAAQIESGAFQADALEASADAEGAQRSTQRLSTLGQWVLDTLRAQMAAHRDAMSALSTAARNNEKASLLAAAPLSKG